MSKAALIMVAALNQGYWFGGEPGQIKARWALEKPVPAAILLWELDVGKVQLAQGRVRLDPDGEESLITITTPEVRARTAVKFTWTLTEADGDEQLERGSLTVHLFPKDLLAGTGKLLAKRRLIVWDKPTGIPAILKEAKLDHVQIDDASGLQFTVADIILVGPDQIGDRPFDQAALSSLAESGRSVMIFAQRQPPRLIGYPLAARRTTGRLQWRLDHPLLHELHDADVESCLHADAAPLAALRLPADEPVYEVGFWPRKTPGTAPVSIDALLAVKSVGAGRIVFCQLPLGDWSKDPRALLLLRNALAYLATPPEPTPPPSRRRRPPVLLQHDEPTVTIPSGVEQ